MPESKGNAVSFRLSLVAKEILAKAETHLGSKRSATVEMALRFWDQSMRWPESTKKTGKKSRSAT